MGFFKQLGVFTSFSMNLISTTFLETVRREPVCMNSVGIRTVKGLIRPNSLNWRHHCLIFLSLIPPTFSITDGEFQQHFVRSFIPRFPQLTVTFNSISSSKCYTDWILQLTGFVITPLVLTHHRAKVHNGEPTAIWTLHFQQTAKKLLVRFWDFGKDQDYKRVDKKLRIL